MAMDIKGIRSDDLPIIRKRDRLKRFWKLLAKFSRHFEILAEKYPQLRPMRKEIKRCFASYASDYVYMINLSRITDVVMGPILLIELIIGGCAYDYLLIHCGFYCVLLLILFSVLVFAAIAAISVTLEGFILFRVGTSRRLIAMLLGIGSLAASASNSFVNATNDLSIWRSILEGATLMGGSMAITLVSLIVLRNTAIWSARRKLCLENPKDRLIVNLWSVASRLHKYYSEAGDRKYGLVNLKTQRRLLESIEEAAECLEMLPRRLSPSIGTKVEWMRRECSKRALAMRDLKMAVALPKGDTHEWLIGKFIAALVVTVKGSLDQLDAKDEILIQRPLGERILLLSKEILVALLPAGAVWSLHFYSVEFIEKYLNLAMSSAIIWAAVQLMAVLEPKLKEKFALMKEIPGLFGPKGEK